MWSCEQTEGNESTENLQRTESGRKKVEIIAEEIRAPNGAANYWSRGRISLNTGDNRGLNYLPPRCGILRITH